MCMAAACVMLCMVACKGKTTFDDVIVKVQGNEMVFYKSGEKYNGELWSADDRMCDIVEDGRIQESTVYHPNGKVAVHIKDGKTEYFDESGKEMDQTQFMEKYYDEISKALEAMQNLKMVD